MARPRVDFDRIEGDVLMQFYLSFVDDVPGGHSIEWLSDVLKHPQNAIFLVVENLIKRAFLKKEEAGYYSEERRPYYMTRKGVDAVQSWADDEYELVCERLGVGPVLAPVLGEDGGAWAPLQIDRAAPAYADVVDAVERALGAVEGDNGFAATAPEERDQIVWSLRQGLDALKEHLPSRDQVYALLVGPLKFVIRKFGEHGVSELAKVAVAKLIGVFF